MTSARPINAASTSAGTFTLGALLPVVAAALLPQTLLVPGEAVASLLFLALLG